MALKIQPIDVSEACDYVSRFHRHHRPPQGYKLCLAVNNGECVVGVLIAGRPVSRMLDNGTTLEVTRCCTDGTKNACSILYAHAWKAARAIGYSRMITYTLPEEGGASLKAAGWTRVAEVKGSKWTNNTRVRADDHPLCDKWRWEIATADHTVRFEITKDEIAQPNLFSELEITDQPSLITVAQG